jgi:hypothetical protein
MATINDVGDSIEQEGQGEVQQEEDASTDSDTPIAVHRRATKIAPREKVIIDLTGDTEDDDDSEGSWFSPWASP